MVIESLTSIANSEHIIVGLECDEIEILSDLLYQKTKSGEADKNTYDLYTQMRDLLELVEGYRILSKYNHS